MNIGIRKEAVAHEHRVALTPSGVKSLVQDGARVWVEKGAGVEAGFSDVDYQNAGATTVYSRGEVFGRAAVVVGVHAPAAADYDLLVLGQAVVAFWGLASARPEDAQPLLEREITAVGIEVTEDDAGRAPILTSMSRRGAPRRGAPAPAPPAARRGSASSPPGRSRAPSRR